MEGTYHARFAHQYCSTGHGPPLPDIPDPPQSVRLTGAVGEGGRNAAEDVLAVQRRLNLIAPADGGPTPALVEDGKCGPLTKAAILKFQRRYPELLKDGRIDPDKNTWKKLVALSGGLPVASSALPKPPASGGSGQTVSAKDSIEVQKGLILALFATKARVFASISALDGAQRELGQVELYRSFSSALKPMTLHQAYADKLATLVELPQVDRCFHIVNPNMALAGTQDVLRRLRKVYLDMVDVIVATLITTPAAEQSDVKRFIRSAPNASFLRMYPPNGAVANAEEGGWWKKNANLSHILVNDTRLDAADLATTILHEMSHFVSHSTSFQIGDHHPTGLYKGAFNDSHAQAVRNSFCYEWYSMLATFPSNRKLSNADLPSLA